MQQDIVYFKLITGEDVVAYTDSENEEFFVISNPIQFITQNSSKGALLRSAKWIPFTEEEIFSLSKKNVIFSLKPSDDIIEYYLETLEVLNQKENSTEDEDAIQTFLKNISNTNITVH